MKARRSTPLVIALLAFMVVALPHPAKAASADGGISSRNATVDGLQLHYLTAGHGPAVVLLHGYTETSRMWRPIIPQLAEKFTVIAPDLPGIGDSAVPKDGIDMKTSAIRIHRWSSRWVSRRPASSATTLD